jgi:hypothetical protein
MMETTKHIHDQRSQVIGKCYLYVDIVMYQVFIYRSDNLANLTFSQLHFDQCHLFQPDPASVTERVNSKLFAVPRYCHGRR